MGNGTTGDFWLPVAHLRQVLEDIPGETELGMWFRDLTPVTAAEFKRCLSEFGDANLPVKEQEFRWFVARLTPDINTFVAVSETSPLCAALCSLHVPGSYNTNSQPERNGVSRPEFTSRSRFANNATGFADVIGPKATATKTVVAVLVIQEMSMTK